MKSTWTKLAYSCLTKSVGKTVRARVGSMTDISRRAFKEEGNRTHTTHFLESYNHKVHYGVRMFRVSSNAFFNECWNLKMELQHETVEFN